MSRKARRTAAGRIGWVGTCSCSQLGMRLLLCVNPSTSRGCGRCSSGLHAQASHMASSHLLLSTYMDNVMYPGSLALAPRSRHLYFSQLSIYCTNGKLYTAKLPPTHVYKYTMLLYSELFRVNNHPHSYFETHMRCHVTTKFCLLTK